MDNPASITSMRAPEWQLDRASAPEFCSDAQATKPIAMLCFSVKPSFDVMLLSLFRAIWGLLKLTASVTLRLQWMWEDWIALSIRHYHESKCDWFGLIWTFWQARWLQSFAASHPSEYRESKGRKRLNHFVFFFFFFPATVMREIPGILYMVSVYIYPVWPLLQVSFFVSVRHKRAHTHTHIKNDKLAVTFTRHVTLKAKRREIMILG